MNLQDFEKLANGLGLVPMLILSDLFTPYRPKDIAGFFPDTALDLFQKEVAVPVGADGKALEVKSTTPAAPPENAGADPGTVVEIPDSWAELHHLKRVKLARDLTGRTDIAKADEADAVITAEVERRAPAAPPENAGADPGTVVEIPDSWAELHHLKRVKLARDLTGRTDIAKADEADAVITAEVERRAPAAPPENAGA